METEGGLFIEVVEAAPLSALVVAAEEADVAAVTGGLCFHTRSSDMARRGWVVLYSEVKGANWEVESSWLSSSSSLMNISEADLEV